MIRDRPTACCKEPLALQSDGMQDFVVPEGIALGCVGFLFDTSDQAERFRGFYIELSQDLRTAGTPFVAIEDRCRVFPIRRTVNNDGIFASGYASCAVDENDGGA